MKIKIIKGDKDKWYSDRIGKVYVVMKILYIPGVLKKRFVIRNYRNILRTIAFNDAEIILEI